MAYTPMGGSEYPNIVNVTKRLDPNGKIAKIAELLTQYNPILEDMPVIEGNLPTGHRSTIRADLPTPTWRKLNYGVKATKSKTVQVDDTIGMLEDYAEVDKELSNLNGNSAAFRLSEDTPHIEAMAQAMATTTFYGDTATHPERFLGLAPRYDSLTLTGTKPSAQVQSSQLNHVVDMQGTTNLTSIFLVTWGDHAVHGLYPKGSNQGIHHADLGEVTLRDDEGNRFQGYRSHYQWKLGMAIRDWRHVVRIANIDVTSIDDEDAQKALYKAMIKALHTVPANNMGHRMFYCSPVIAAMLDLAATEKTNVSLSYTEVFGKELTAFRLVPVRPCNAIIENEARVV